MILPVCFNLGLGFGISLIKQRHLYCAVLPWLFPITAFGDKTCLAFCTVAHSVLIVQDAQKTPSTKLPHFPAVWQNIGVCSISFNLLRWHNGASEQLCWWEAPQPFCSQLELCARAHMSGLTTSTARGNVSKSENDLSPAIWDWQDAKLSVLSKFCLKMEAPELGDLSRPHYYSFNSASFGTQTRTHLPVSILIIFQIIWLQSNPSPGF